MKRAATLSVLVVLGLGPSLQADVFHMPAGLKSLETVVVGEPGNPPDDTGFGAVAYPYKIGKYEVTAAQYVEFLNAKAKSDSWEQYGLYNDSVLESSWGFRLERNGQSGCYRYSVEPEYANQPMVMVSFWNAVRFCNWLHNGQGDGDTEDGAYTLKGRMQDDQGAVRRNPGARWFLPSEEEWYKAAYYDPHKPTGTGYWDYPTRGDAELNRDFAGSNAANLNTGELLSPVTTVVGAFGRSGSAYGTFDQGGNVAEWTESVGYQGLRPHRCLRGGSFVLGAENLRARARDFALPTQPNRLVGFRVAGAVADEHGALAAAPGAGVAPPPAEQAELWASPRELRDKKNVGVGMYSTPNVSWPNRVEPHFLAAHPDFVATHPFDGVTLLLPLDKDWIVRQGMEGNGNYGDLDTLAWSRIAVPFAAVQDSVAALKSISWGHLTDNFLWYRMVQAHQHGPDVSYGADFTDDSQWASVEKNAALMARICRDVGFKGFMLDTEQYGRYDNGQCRYTKMGPPWYPMGKDDPELVRRRGRQWIEAVQAEYPAITIIIFFAWSPDVVQADFLSGIQPFLNGVLEGIEQPARLVHGYENTFYFGHIAGSRYTEEGFPGGRAQHQRVRDNITNQWGVLSGQPKKYDQFVETGMAAWVESDPWDRHDPLLSGSKNTIWSNLPLALAYSKEYVWTWSEHTNYAESFLRGSEPNPFLLSVSNQTFNTGREAVAELAEDFQSNPLLRGWYFDFDMLDAGRKQDPTHAVPIFSLDAVPYAWSPAERAVRVQGTWLTGPEGKTVAHMGQQRRRYVHPLEILDNDDTFRAEFDFQVETFGTDPTNPIVLGFFHSDAPVNRQCLTLRIDGPMAATVTLAGDGQPWVSALDLKGDLQVNTRYRLVFDRDGPAGRFQAKLTSRADSALVGQIEGELPARVGPFQWDEVGLAQWDAQKTGTPPEKAYRYRLHAVKLERR